MTLQEQLQKLKENWLLVVLVLAVVLFSQFGSGIIPQGITPLYAGAYDRAGYGGVAKSMAVESYIVPPQSGDFAPEAADRKITKTASLTTEVGYHYFWEAQNKLQSIVASADAYLLQQNVNKYDVGRKSYYFGNYQIKIDTRKYDAVVQQLKEIGEGIDGEVTFFSENSADITSSFTSLQAELQAEKARLERYQGMLRQAATVSEKLELSDRIFNQERTIQYLEDALKNVGQQVEYSTIYVTIQEKRSAYADIVFVKLSELVQRFVSSVDNVITLVIAALPYAVAVLLVWLGVKWARRRK